jgi:uncharacterized membrane-anchored protein
MISTFMTWPYAKFKEDGAPALILGLRETTGGTIQVVAVDMKNGDLSVVDLKEVIIDIEKLRKLPAL